MTDPKPARDEWERRSIKIAANADSDLSGVIRTSHEGHWVRAEYADWCDRRIEALEKALREVIPIAQNEYPEGDAPAVRRAVELVK